MLGVAWLACLVSDEGHHHKYIVRYRCPGMIGVCTRTAVTLDTHSFKYIN